MSYSAKIKAFREGRKMTHQQFADAVGVSRGAVQQWESGATAPKRANQPDVAKFMGLSVGELMSDDVALNGGDATPSLPAASHYTEGTKQPPALTGIAPAAINDVASALVILCQSLGGLDPSRRDAVIGSLTTLVRSPGDALVRDQLAQMLGDAGFADQSRKAA